ncbi:hypothetical protein ACFL5H_01390 [Candidatus Latescibacterota bacterium]
MESIFEKLDEVKKLHVKVGDDFVTSRLYEENREWMVLCEAVIHLKNNGLIYPSYADKIKPSWKDTQPIPDFITYTESKEVFRPVEITEILEPDRKRTKEYREEQNKDFSVEIIQQVKDPWKNFIKKFNDKINKRYFLDSSQIQNCWLIMYHNMFYNQITEAGVWHDLVIENFKKFCANKAIDEKQISSSSFEKILVINASFNAMVELYPDLHTITPEN